MLVLSAVLSSPRMRNAPICSRGSDASSRTTGSGLFAIVPPHSLDKETRRQGERSLLTSYSPSTLSPYQLFPRSPCLLVSLSPCLSTISVSLNEEEDSYPPIERHASIFLSMWSDRSRMIRRASSLLTSGRHLPVIRRSFWNSFSRSRITSRTAAQLI